MLFTFQCPACTGKLEAESSYGGHLSTCPHCGTSVAVPYAQAGPGTTVGGFRIERLLGKGGMGEVFLATQLSMERYVAVKILPTAFVEDEDAVARFMHEVRTSAKLDHPNIVSAIEAGNDDGTMFLAMTYVDGMGLDTRLKIGGAIPEKEALEIVRTVADALDYAWEKFSLLHRDIKPANIMIDQRGRVQLMDLGLAKSIGEESGMTVSGAILGTPHYMSPEQAGGRSDLDLRSDVYSLGGTLYHLVTGTTPFLGDSALSIMGKHVHETLTSPRERNPAVSHACVDLIERMMAKNREDRPATWQDVIKLIDDTLAGKVPSKAKAAQEALARQAREALHRQHNVTAGNVKPAGHARTPSKEPVPEPAPQSPAGHPRKSAAGGKGKRPSKGTLVLAGVAVLLLVIIGGVAMSRSKPPPAATVQPNAAGNEPVAAVVLPDHADVQVPVSSSLPPGETKPAADTPHRATQHPAWDQLTIPHTGNWALQFDGKDDYVVVPTLKYDGTYPITLEVVVNVSEDKPAVIAGSMGNTGVRLVHRDDSFHVRSGGMDMNPCGIQYPGGRTAHLAGVWDGRQKHLYVNGVHVAAVDSQPLSGEELTPLALAVYTDTKGSPRSDYLNGCIQSVRVSKGVRYTEQFDLESALPLRPDANTLCLLDLEEGQGDIAKDTSGNGHDGEIHGATWEPMWPCPVSEKRLRELEQALMDANPAIQKLSITAAGRPDALALTLADNKELSDIRPLVGLPIGELNLVRTAVRDLSPLKGMPLKALYIEDTRVTDFSPLRDLPLQLLSCTRVQVRDLSPLSGCPLASFGAYLIPVSDLSPLSSCPLRNLLIPNCENVRSLPEFPAGKLEILHAQKTSISDIRMLAGQPLKHVHMGGTQVRDLSPLKTCPDLQTLTIPESLALRDASALLPQAKKIDNARSWEEFKKDSEEVWAQIHRQIFPPVGSPAPEKEYLPWDRIILPHTGNWALEFNGKDDYVTIPTLKYDGTYPVTLEAVVRAEPNEMSVVLGNPQRAGFWLEHNNDMWGFGTCVGDKPEVHPLKATTFRRNYAHLAGVWDGSTMRLYVNGIRMASDRVEAPNLVSPACFLVGSNPGDDSNPTGQWLKGTVECIRISRTARYTDNFRIENVLPFRPDRDTLCLLDFEEGEGNRAKDLSGNGHDGEIHGATWKSMWPCPLSEEKLREVETALCQTNPSETDLRLRVCGRPGSIAVEVAEQPELLNIEPLANLPISEFRLVNSNVENINVLGKMPLRILYLATTRIRDLSPLQDTSLVCFSAAYCPIEDLSPLKGMPLRRLAVYSCQVRDLSPLVGMPLTSLALCANPISDISPLKDCPICFLHLGGCEHLHELGILTSIKELQVLRLHGNDPSLVSARRLAPGIEIDTQGEDASLFHKLDGEFFRELSISLWQNLADRMPSGGRPQVLQDVAASCLDGDFNASLNAWEKRPKNTKSGFGQDVQTTVDAVCTMPQRILDSFKTDIGKKGSILLASGAVSCEIREVEGDVIKIYELVKRGETTGKVGRTIRYNDLSVQEKLRRLGKEDTPELNIMRGLLAVAGKRPDLAKKLFEKAGGPLTDALIAELDNRERQQAEAEADQAARQLLRSIARSSSATQRNEIISEIRVKCGQSPSQVRQTRKSLDVYEKEYGTAEQGKKWADLIRDALTYPWPGEDWTVPDLGMEFVWIEPMKIWVGKYEVTNAEYRRFKPEHKMAGKGPVNDDRSPVGAVGTPQVNAFCQWLEAREDREGRSCSYEYRLPTEKEWMVFAKCGTNRIYPWGNEWPPPNPLPFNYCCEGDEGQEPLLGYSDGHRFVCHVEESGRNDWGLYGVGGNVWERCSGDIWKGGSSCWGPRAKMALEYANPSRSLCGDIGFRLVLAPALPESK